MLFVYIYSAIIQGGKLTDSPYIAIRQDVNGAHDEPFRLYFSTQEYRFFHYNDEYRTTKDPLEDKDFRNKITDTIQEIIKSVFLEDTQKK